MQMFDDTRRVAMLRPRLVRNRGRRVCVGLAAAALACALSGAALAATRGYAVRVSVPNTVVNQGIFTVKVKGFSPSNAPLYVFLEYRKCAASFQEEYSRDSAYKAGESYFAPGTATLKGYAVFGAFKKAPKAKAGAISGRRYVCAYLTSPNLKRTKARASTSYEVTR